MLGELLTRWTIRLALACYAAYVGGLLARRDFSAGPIARWLCTAGCLAFLAHVACAFDFYYGWSHAAALEATARQTEALLGVRFGAGIYFSYLFGAVWLLDVIRLWGLTGIGRKPPVLVHAYLFFIAFHGAIVFEAGPTRWAGITACLVLAGLGVRRAYNAKSVPRGSPRETVHEDRKASVLSNE